MKELILYSDGGGQKSSTAAGACIIEGPSGKFGFAIFLGEATNNESEISGGLLGFSIIRSLFDDSEIKLRWVCDSEYVLKSATEYIKTWQRNNWKTAAKQDVKNQGLWRAFLGLSKGFKISPMHVPGHSGHPENETCDSVSTWCRFNAEALLTKSTFAEFDFESEIGISKWVVVDGRKFLAILRESFDEESVQGAISLLSVGKIDPKEAKLRQLKTQLEKASSLALDLDMVEVVEGIGKIVKNNF